jgi:hypothetical protein
MGMAPLVEVPAESPPDEPVAEVEVWPTSGADEIERRKMTKAAGRAIRERIARGHLDWGREWFARDMEPELFSLEDQNHKPFGLGMAKMRCKLLSRRSLNPEIG